MTVVDVLLTGAKGEVQNVKNFIQTPQGPFEALDNIVETARRTVFDAVASVGIHRPLISSQGISAQAMRGQIGSLKVLNQVRTRVQTVRTNMQSRMKNY